MKLTSEDKARSVMSRTGQPGNRVATFTPAEIAELAAVYDECGGGEGCELRLAPLVAAFWARHQERLAELKAADDGPHDRFRNRPTATPDVP